MKRIPMPSPKSTNREGLFLSSHGFALDSAPAQQPMSKRAFDRMYDYLQEEHGREVADGLWNAMVGPAYEAEEPAEDQGGGGWVDGEWHSDVSDLEKTNRDELPTYRRNGLPKNDVEAKNGTELGMDGRSLRDLMKHTKIGYP
jgi:hypothetical protein